MNTSVLYIINNKIAMLATALSREVEHRIGSAFYTYSI
jgi:hypothetical protein